MIKMAMYRETQNPDTPNLPFAQTRFSTMYRDMQNPDTPNLPFAQGFSTQEKQYVLMSLGTLTQNVAVNARNLVQMGKDMTKIGQDNIWFGKKITELENRPSNTTTHDHVFEKVHPKQTQQLIKMGKDMTDLGDNLSEALAHRKSIESKVEANISKFPDIHTKLTGLGKSVSDVSSGLEAHKLGHNGNGCDCDWWDIGCKAECGIEGIIPYILIGGLALFVMRKKR